MKYFFQNTNQRETYSIVVEFLGKVDQIKEMDQGEKINTATHLLCAKCDIKMFDIHYLTWFKSRTSR